MGSFSVRRDEMTARQDQAQIIRAIGERMRQARELCNLSRSEAARRLGYSNPSKLSKIERSSDTNSVPLWVLKKAAIIYDVSLDFLFGLSSDWETGARSAIERENSSWMLSEWQKLRERDMAVIRKLNDRHEAIAGTVQQCLELSLETDRALSLFSNRNPEFEDMPGGARLVSSVNRAVAAAMTANAKLRKLKLECKSVGLEESPQKELPL